MNDNINISVEINAYKSFKAQLDAELNRTADGFVKIGYLLRRAEDTDVLKESGYKSVTEFAAAEYGLTTDVVSRYININKKYSENGYSDKLAVQYQGFGMAKLAEMLTLPKAISDALPDDLSKSEIREIKKEYEAEQNITDMEVAIEAAELEVSEHEQQAAGQGLKQADTDKYDVVYHIIKYWLHDNPQEFLKLSEGIEQSKDEQFVKNVIAPNGTKVIITRVPGVGKLMMTCKADEGIEIVNMRSSEMKKAEWTEVDDAVVILCCAYKDEGETYKEVWQKLYDEPYPEAEEKVEKQQEPKQSLKPVEKKTEKRKQSKVAVVNKKKPEKVAEPIPDEQKEPEPLNQLAQPEDAAEQEVKPEQFEPKEAPGQENIQQASSLDDNMKLSFKKGMNEGAILELQGIKKEIDIILAELLRREIDEPEGFSVLKSYIKDRLKECEALREGQAIEYQPEYLGENTAIGCIDAQCKCGNIVRSYQKFCDECGIKFDWSNCTSE